TGSWLPAALKTGKPELACDCAGGVARLRPKSTERIRVERIDRGRQFVVRRLWKRSGNQE
ncbi:hypothetical protein, partial [Mesorhizobium sp. M7A.F.Ca.CA.002.15.1.1]|uniref:hypothetical protein n=1 Tax=Mesorhizobium sp. M7A.F.Ca.CA.002.15.1.1 TaxID=2496717 RepID=UPI0019CF6841